MAGPDPSTFEAWDKVIRNLHLIKYNKKTPNNRTQYSESTQRQPIVFINTICAILGGLYPYPEIKSILSAGNLFNTAVYLSFIQLLLSVDNSPQISLTTAVRRSSNTTDDNCQTPPILLYPLWQIDLIADEKHNIAWPQNFIKNQLHADKCLLIVYMVCKR